MSKDKQLSWLENSFAFYASYHHNPVNQIIHFICIWPIFWTFMLMLSYTKPIDSLDFVSEQLPEGYEVNICLILAAMYFVYYLLIELPGIAGPIAAALVAFSYVSTHYVRELYPDSWKIAAVINIVAWLLQFYGHGVHEGRSPALLDNLFQAFMMAPLFVVMENLFKLGYRPNFQKRMKAVVDANLAKFKAEKKKAK